MDETRLSYVGGERYAKALATRRASGQAIAIARRAAIWVSRKSSLESSDDRPAPGPTVRWRPPFLKASRDTVRG